jgi:hypothetical protein
MFMSADAQTSAPTAPSQIGRVLSSVRKLIDYGRQLAATVQQFAATPGFRVFAKPFGTADVAAILARITAGLRRAAALEALLCRRAERGEDLAPALFGAHALGAPRAPRQVGPPRTPPQPSPAEDPRLARLPTVQEIAAEVRRRPVGAVIVDICRDLGITPGRLDRAFWDELGRMIILHGGNFVRFLKDLDRWLFPPPSSVHASRAVPASSEAFPALATGPP